jgi:predicted benzoate:H+ symporter BenE
MIKKGYTILLVPVFIVIAMIIYVAQGSAADPSQVSAWVWGFLIAAGIALVLGVMFKVE